MNAGRRSLADTAMVRWLRKDRVQQVSAGALLAGGGLAMLLAGYLLWPRDRLEPTPDFTAFEPGDERKEAFFQYFLPLVEQRNEEILDLRANLLDLHDDLEALSGGQARRVERIAAEYGMEDFEATTPDGWNILLRRVDVVPPSLALAQAANESAWGTSRFAREGNNYYGHWCFVAGCGLIPDSRPAGARHEVAAFSSAQHSVERYIHNLNQHEAYQDLRIMRSELRENEQPITGLKLAEGLERYSERGQEYIDELRAMIRFNGLDEYDPATTAGGSQAPVSSP